MQLVPSTYKKEDCIYLLKDLSSVNLELPTNIREQQMQGSGHYSESLPMENLISESYKEYYFSQLNETKYQLASYIGILANKILAYHSTPFVLVSLARGGTPIGALLSRYIKQFFGIDVVHYSVSIIRGKGIDLQAIRYITLNHPQSSIQFVDGWTGKGAISKELIQSCKEFNELYQMRIEPNLAVIADPGGCATICATREDFLVANSLLNSTISGLISRTVLNSSFIFDGDFHGAKFYSTFASEDQTNMFLDTISNCFSNTSLLEPIVMELTFEGWKQIEAIAKRFGVTNMNLIKPSLGEATRVLLRRKPWKLLIKNMNHPNVQHLLLLAKEKDIPIIEYPEMNYLACGIISQIGKE